LPKKGISGRELARKNGRTENAVRKHVKNGKLHPLEDGSFDPDTPWPVEDEVRGDFDEVRGDLEKLLDDLEHGNLTDARRAETILRSN
jgi:hypothetical protein